MNELDSDRAPVAEHVKRLMLLRSALACTLAATMGVATLGFGVDLRWGPMIGVLLLLPAANVLAQRSTPAYSADPGGRAVSASPPRRRRAVRAALSQRRFDQPVSCRSIYCL